MTLKVFTAFSGVGAPELALRQLGIDHEVVGYSEVDKYAIETYERNFNGHKNFGDITKINERDLPDFDIFIGGFPCQAFSIAGKRRGFEDARGTLFFDIARILAHKKPKHLLLENVKGLLNHDKGNTFNTIVRILTETGYDISWAVHNSKNYGVPQNRERIYIIGHLRGTPRPQVFPIGENDGSPVKKNQQELKSTIKKDYKAIALHNSRRIATITDTVNTISSTYRGSPDGDGRPAIIQLNNPTHSNDRVYSDEGISPTLNTMQGGMRQPFIAPVLTPDRLNKRQNGRRMKENGEPAYTVTAQDRHGIYNGVKIRRLTPLECERLQGFPDGWAAGVSDTQRYKQMGNAMTVNVVQEVLRQMYRNK